MTPSPEAVAVCSGLALIPIIEERVNHEYLVRVVDSKLAPYRERVRKLVEAADKARWNLDTDVQNALDAALAPFLEQETPT